MKEEVGMGWRSRMTSARECRHSQDMDWGGGLTHLASRDGPGSSFGVLFLVTDQSSGWFVG